MSAMKARRKPTPAQERARSSAGKKPSVKIVTDSAADIPKELAERLGIGVVPLVVNFGEKSFRDGVDLSPVQFWTELRRNRNEPSTAAPAPEQFRQLFQTLADEGASEIVSIHLSSKLSATFQSASKAATEWEALPVCVFDSLSASAGTGLLVLRAAELAATGITAADITEHLESYRKRLRFCFTLDTLEYLRRGGRIGRAQAVFGSSLQIKPIIEVADGEVEPVERVRTRRKALEHLISLLPSHASDIEHMIVVGEDADDLHTIADLSESTGHGTPQDLWIMGSTIGAHAGPGVVGVAFIQSK